MRDIALALFIFGTIPFILSRPYIGLLVWSWLGYMNPNRLCYGFAVNFPWVMVIAVLTMLSIAVSKESKSIPVRTISVLLFVFLLWTGVTTIFAVEPAAAWAAYQQFAKILIMVFVTLIMVKDRQRLHWLVWLIVVSLGFYGLRGGVFTLLTGGNYHVYGPDKSFISDNNDLAQALCMCLPLMRYLQLQVVKRWQKMAIGIWMLLTGIAIMGTYSRGGMIALAVVAGALLLKGRRQITLAAFFVVLALTAYHFMPDQWIARMDTIQHAEQVNSAQTRMQSWEFAGNVALHRPMVGGGCEVYRNTAMWERFGPEGARQRAIHSIYFRILGEQGFIGLAIFLSLVAASWRSCTKVRKQLRGIVEAKWAFDLASMLQVSLLAFAVAGLATTSSYFDLSYQLMALCLILRLIAERIPVSPAPKAESDKEPVAAGETWLSAPLRRRPS
jgi:probable O-glycosylation ligase (exosortase A-associated)